MKRILIALLWVACLPQALAQIDEETRQRAIAFVGGLRPPPSLAGEAVPAPLGTLKKLAEGGSLYLGYRDDAFPLSYHGKDDKPAGMIWEQCLDIANALASKLGLPSVPVVAVPVTPNTRELYLHTHVIDLECGGTINTVNRQRKVAFGVNSYLAGVRLLTRKTGGMTGLGDFANRTLVSLAGSPVEHYARTATVLRGTMVRYLTARDAAEALRLVEEGKADAFVGDDITLALALASLPAAGADKFLLLSDALSFVPQAVMLRKDDGQLKQVVDDTLAAQMKDGRYEARYRRWFESVAGDEGLNLKLPMNDMLRGLLQSPNDIGI